VPLLPGRPPRPRSPRRKTGRAPPRDRRPCLGRTYRSLRADSGSSPRSRSVHHARTGHKADLVPTRSPTQASHKFLELAAPISRSVRVAHRLSPARGERRDGVTDSLQNAAVHRPHVSPRASLAHAKTDPVALPQAGGVQRQDDITQRARRAAAAAKRNRASSYRIGGRAVLLVVAGVVTLLVGFGAMTGVFGLAAWLAQSDTKPVPTTAAPVVPPSSAAPAVTAPPSSAAPGPAVQSDAPPPPPEQAPVSAPPAAGAPPPVSAAPAPTPAPAPPAPNLNPAGHAPPGRNKSGRNK
jgi:hypothetical protein